MSHHLHQPAVPGPRTRDRRGTRPAVAALLVLASLGVTACGDDDPDPTTTTTGSTPTATTPTGGAGGAPSAGVPGDGEQAIRAALERSADSTTKARTARLRLEMSSGPIATSAEGTADLVEQRYALDQTVKQGSQEVRLKGYGENDRVYIQPPGGSDWVVTQNPVGSSDPLAQAQQLQKARITGVGDVETYDGVRCRSFTAEVAVADVVDNVNDPTAKALIDGAPDGAAIPVTACIDDAGLTYRLQQDFAAADVFGPAAASAGRTKIDVRMSDYGSAPSPQRPDGIDDATPAPSTGTAG
ncbi:MAG: hypothetical protein M0P31_15200 [Solirubrobacteraceae bacterium]|nr:hypothetical protein [Solirubrobacteraceae bacterium]